MGHFLGILAGEKAARRQGVVVHFNHLHPLIMVEVQQHILADDQAIILANGAQVQQIVVLKEHMTAENILDLKAVLFSCRFEIFFKQQPYSKSIPQNRTIVEYFNAINEPTTNIGANSIL